MLLTGPSRIYIAQSPWQFGDFHKIFWPNIGEGQKKVVPFEHGALGTVPYGKSAPGYCITFIKKLDKDLSRQPLGQNP